MDETENIQVIIPYTVVVLKNLDSIPIEDRHKITHLCNLHGVVIYNFEDEEGRENIKRIFGIDKGLGNYKLDGNWSFTFIHYYAVEKNTAVIIDPLLAEKLVEIKNDFILSKK